MPADSGQRVANNAVLNDAQARRVRSLRNAYQKALGRLPTTIERAAMIRAATLTARVEIEAVNVNVSADHLARLDGAAARARRDFFAMVERSKPKPLATSLDQYLAEKGLHT